MKTKPSAARRWGSLGGHTAHDRLAMGMVVMAFDGLIVSFTDEDAARISDVRAPSPDAEPMSKDPAPMGLLGLFAGLWRCRSVFVR